MTLKGGGGRRAVATKEHQGTSIASDKTTNVELIPKVTECNFSRFFSGIDYAENVAVTLSWVRAYGFLLGCHETL